MVKVGVRSSSSTLATANGAWTIGRYEVGESVDLADDVGVDEEELTVDEGGEFACPSEP